MPAKSLDAEIRKCKAKKRWLLVGSYSLLAVAAVFGFSGQQGASEIALWGSVFVGGALLGGGVRAIVERVATLKDKELLGPLLEVTGFDDAEAKQIAVASIKVILKPGIGPGEAKLNDRQTEALCVLLRRTQDADLAASVLRYVKGEEDERCLDTLDGIANGGSGLSGDDKGRLENLARMVSADIRMAYSRKIINRETAVRQSELQRAVDATVRQQ